MSGEKSGSKIRFGGVYAEVPYFLFFIIDTLAISTGLSYTRSSSATCGISPAVRRRGIGYIWNSIRKLKSYIGGGACELVVRKEPYLPVYVVSRLPSVVEIILPVFV